MNPLPRCLRGYERTPSGLSQVLMFLLKICHLAITMTLRYKLSLIVIRLVDGFPRDYYFILDVGSVCPATMLEVALVVDPLFVYLQCLCC